MSDQLDCVVIGAGVVGLACARALALAGREVVVLEAADAVGTGTSSRNSEVIHAGIYYPAGSLKAGLCVEGKAQLYAYCASMGVPHRRLGKLIVATGPEEEAALEGYLARAVGNGVDDLRRLARDDIRRLEPALECRAALLSPSTGIVDSHRLMLALQGEAESRGAVVVLRTPVVGGAVTDTGIELRTGGAEPATIQARSVVNSAGLDAQALARSLRGVPAGSVPGLHLAKGHYFTLRGHAPFRHLVYPVAESGGLGIHLTLDMGGQARFGPDVQWITARDYAFDASREPRFVAAIRRYWPGLPNQALAPGYTGIRPKLAPPGQGSADFMIQGSGAHGIPGLVNLFGIESPGLTACLAIAGQVVRRLAVDQ